MKLRLRSLETKRTHKIETPDPCSLHQLKQLLLNSLNPHNPPSFENLHLSLNRRDELQSSSPNEEESIQSLHIISGDLIFFTFNPSAFSSHNSQITLNPSTILPSSSQEVEKPTLDETKNSKTTLNSTPNLQSDDIPPQGGKPTSDETSNSLNTLESTLNLQKTEALKEELVEKEEIAVDVQDDMEVDDDINYEGNVGKSVSVPGFLRKVFTEELGDCGGGDHELSIIAIHAILLESGFVGFDPVSRMKVNEFQFRSDRLSLYYTLPEMIRCATESIDAIVLKFNSLSNYTTVYACLLNHKSVVHSVTFDEHKLVPFLNIVWANCGLTDEFFANDGVSSTSAEKKVFEFWRNVKDELALPLLIDLCEKAGYVLPPCFTRLPTDLKLKILEFLPGADVAKVSCISSELRYLSSSDELWKKKYVEQFGDPASTVEGGYWKQKFVNSWENLKRNRMFDRVPSHIEFFPPPIIPRFIGGPHDMWPHGVIGGDYDRLPQPLGGFLPGLGGGIHPVRRARRHPLHTRCNLSGSGNNSNFL